MVVIAILLVDFFCDTVINLFVTTDFLYSKRGVFADRLFNRINISIRNLFLRNEMFSKIRMPRSCFSSRAKGSRKIPLWTIATCFSSSLSRISQYLEIFYHKYSSSFDFNR